MRSDLTDITLVVDRSGSMDQMRGDAEGGINAFIQGQAKEPGEALLTLVQFDTEYDFVHRGVPIDQVPRYSLEPRGATALLDAVGRGIQETGKRLALMEESARPGLVAFVIVTDGLENSSREFVKDDIREMIEHQQTKYNWKFTYLGANQDAFSEAGAMGISAMGIASYSSGKEAQVYGATMNKLARMRAMVRHAVEPDNDFTEEEREQMK